MISAKIIEDSVFIRGTRLTTFQLKYPRYIHAELMTHRVFSRNASSSRAIPVGKLAQLSLEEMVEPIMWGINQPGMQSKDTELTGAALEKAKNTWRLMAEVCASGAAKLAELGLHKQWANRPLEWFGHINVVVTATEWDNWYALRNHPDAQPEIKALAQAMLLVQESSTPKDISNTDDEELQWHLPYVSAEERNKYEIGVLRKLSAARCARVSYLKHDGANPNLAEDLLLYDRLVGSAPIHASPIEHQAVPDWKSLDATKEWSGNFRGWIQYRKLVEERLP